MRDVMWCDMRWFETKARRDHDMRTMFLVRHLPISHDIVWFPHHRLWWHVDRGWQQLQTHRSKEEKEKEKGKGKMEGRENDRKKEREKVEEKKREKTREMSRHGIWFPLELMHHPLYTNNYKWRHSCGNWMEYVVNVEMFSMHIYCSGVGLVKAISHLSLVFRISRLFIDGL